MIVSTRSQRIPSPSREALLALAGDGPGSQAGPGPARPGGLRLPIIRVPGSPACFLPRIVSAQSAQSTFGRRERVWSGKSAVFSIDLDSDSEEAAALIDALAPRHGSIILPVSVRHSGVRS